MNKEKINKDFQALLEVMSDDQFWNWVRGWYDVQNIQDCIENWDEDTKIQEIPRMKKLMEQK